MMCFIWESYYQSSYRINDNVWILRCWSSKCCAKRKHYMLLKLESEYSLHVQLTIFLKNNHDKYY